MKEKIKLNHGSGNVFRDFNDPDADVEQLKAMLAAQVIKMLNREALTVRAAAERTGMAAADFSRIRKVDLNRFTVDRLMRVINRLGEHVEIKVKFKPVERRAAPSNVSLRR